MSDSPGGWFPVAGSGSPFPVLGKNGWPGSRSPGGSVESSSGPTGVWLPEAHALEGAPLLSGAQQVPVQRNLKSLSQTNPPPPVLLFSRLASAVSRSFGSRVSALVGKRLRLNG